MTYSEYKQGALRTANYPKQLAMDYLRLGIRGEAGEVCDKVKKLIRDEGWRPGDPVPGEQREAIILELGDVAWYAACISHETGWKMTVSRRAGETTDVDRTYCDPMSHRAADLVKYALRLVHTVEAEDSYDITPYGVTAYPGWVLYAVAETAACLGYRMSEVMRRNLEKLASRQRRGVIGGSGDDR